MTLHTCRIKLPVLNPLKQLIRLLLPQYFRQHYPLRSTQQTPLLGTFPLKTSHKLFHPRPVKCFLRIKCLIQTPHLVSTEAQFLVPICRPSHTITLKLLLPVFDLFLLVFQYLDQLLALNFILLRLSQRVLLLLLLCIRLLLLNSYFREFLLFQLKLKTFLVMTLLIM